ncbi:MAG: STAS domain-containing protein [Terasakiella sp.]|uniref:STAS domain-containing protein n=1 Tax=unclassified Terasakiella TaxID=2614952 RepID=UPI003B00F6E5
MILSCLRQEADVALCIQGNFTFFESPDLSSLAIEIERGGFDRVIMDMKSCNLIDSTGLGLIMQVNELLEENNIDFEIQNAEGQVARMIHVAGFSSLMSPDRSAA